MVTIKEILMGRAKIEDLSSLVASNLYQLSGALNMVRSVYGKPMIVSSGYRPPSINAGAGGAAKSAHLTCEACDFKDLDRSLAKWCLDNLSILQDAGLYMEDPRWTPNWVHLQTRQTKKRVFIPNSSKPVDPGFWGGQYDGKYDEPTNNIFWSNT